MTSEQLHREISDVYDHDMYDMPASSTMTWNMGSGTDTATNRYFNLPGGFSYGIKIIPEAAVSITEINGRKQKVALPVSTGGFSSGLIKIKNIKVEVENTATTVSVEVKC